MCKEKLITAAIVVAILALAAYLGYRCWKKEHGKKAEKLEGLRHQEREENPYNGQTYQCGQGASGRPYFGPKDAPRRDRFSGDLEGWPQAGTFGALADTYPYANYAGNVDMYYPTYSEGYVEDLYWTRT